MRAVTRYICGMLLMRLALLLVGIVSLLILRLEGNNVRPSQSCSFVEIPGVLFGSDQPGNLVEPGLFSGIPAVRGPLPDDACGD